MRGISTVKVLLWLCAFRFSQLEQADERPVGGVDQGVLVVHGLAVGVPLHTHDAIRQVAQRSPPGLNAALSRGRDVLKRIRSAAVLAGFLEVQLPQLLEQLQKRKRAGPLLVLDAVAVQTLKGLV